MHSYIVTSCTKQLCHLCLGKPNRILIQFHLQPNAIIWLIKYYL